ncbi:MAG: hypothetical protein HY042_04935 [Spirochaetia bacterium]|nr:hypothetical protein [Spirochaetia bacterium]
MLFLVVDEYIRRGEPVSSLYITEHFDTGVSSATIRSIFSDLDQKGFLFAPHRSAGRIPTEMGYRFYVERLPVVRSIEDLDGWSFPRNRRPPSSSTSN